MSATIDAEQCAELLKCDAGTVEELARAGEIPGLKIGRSWLFVTGDLLSFLADKARNEAEQRRSRKAQPKPRRTVPPVLVTR